MFSIIYESTERCPRLGPARVIMLPVYSTRPRRMLVTLASIPSLNEDRECF